MKTSQRGATRRRLVLRAKTAADLMTPNPISVRDDLTVAEAVAFFTDKGYGAAPVIDEAGRPVGVLSQTDIVIHDREKPELALGVSAQYDLATRAGKAAKKGFQLGAFDDTLVRDLMTPGVFSVRFDAPASEVVQQMLEMNVHRLFVVDEDCALVGVVSATDILRCLREDPAKE